MKKENLEERIQLMIKLRLKITNSQLKTAYSQGYLTFNENNN